MNQTVSVAHFEEGIRRKGRECSDDDDDGDEKGRGGRRSLSALGYGVEDLEAVIRDWRLLFVVTAVGLVGWAWLFLFCVNVYMTLMERIN